MLSGEWALIIFTILTQLAVGIWLVAIILRTLIARRSNGESASRLTKPAILVVGPIMSIALVISMFHLGSPMIAYGSIANLGSSWLSREIVFSGLFLFLWIAACVNYRKANSGNTLGWITAILGLLAVFSMASIYHSTPIPAWATINTYIVFFATTVILGSIATASLVGFAAKRSILNQKVVRLLGQISLLALAAIIVQLIFVANTIVGLSDGIGAGQIMSHLLRETYSFPLILHVLLMLVGGFILVAFLYKWSKKHSVAFPLTIYYSTLVIILVGEIMGRYVFYAIGVLRPIG